MQRVVVARARAPRDAAVQLTNDVVVHTLVYYLTSPDKVWLIRLWKRAELYVVVQQRPIRNG